MDVQVPGWRKSTRSGQQTACVEVVRIADGAGRQGPRGGPHAREHRAAGLVRGIRRGWPFRRLITAERSTPRWAGRG
ncbi:DUF397 domain-containing protein [Saccharopolyspora sp. NFXS83]|nr:DUF397 domain-containing protein [Saccharopolyspora sp. NFXS83]